MKKKVRSFSSDTPVPSVVHNVPDDSTSLDVFHSYFITTIMQIITVMNLLLKFFFCRLLIFCSATFAGLWQSCEFICLADLFDKQKRLKKADQDRSIY
jgi:hypothetical protein